MYLQLPNSMTISTPVPDELGHFHPLKSPPGYVSDDYIKLNILKSPSGYVSDDYIKLNILTH